MKKGLFFIFILFSVSLFLASSCSPDSIGGNTYLMLQADGVYQWTSLRPPVTSKTEIIVSERNENGVHIVSRYSVPTGIQAFATATSVKTVEYQEADEVIAALAFQRSEDAPWEIFSYDGRQLGATARIAKKIENQNGVLILKD